MNDKKYIQHLNGKIIFYKGCLNLSKNITFGIEIEYENIIKDTISVLFEERKEYCGDISGWQNKSEFDIMEERKSEELNGEVSSPVLTDNLDTWNDLYTVLNILKANDGIVTEKCGGHIHIGTQILGDNINYWKNFFYLWALYKKEIYSFSSGEFERIRPDYDNLFTEIKNKILLKKIYNANEITDLIYIKELYDKTHELYLNELPCNEFKKGNTIEFRIPNGSLDEDIWKNYINFFARFMLACKKNINFDEIIYKIQNNSHSEIELANLVFDNQIDKDNFLIQSMKTNEKYNKKLEKHITF